jgi:hypothetical protein
MVLDMHDLAEETARSAQKMLSRWRLEAFKRLAPLREAGLRRVELCWEEVSKEEVAALGRVLGSSTTHLYASECGWASGFKSKQRAPAVHASFPNLERLVLDDGEESDCGTESCDSFRLGEGSDSDEDGFGGYYGGSSGDEEEEEGSTDEDEEEDDVSGSCFVKWAGHDQL